MEAENFITEHFLSKWQNLKSVEILLLFPIIPPPSLQTIHVDMIVQGAVVIIKILRVYTGVMVNRK